jgi:hypothetical protein
MASGVYNQFKGELMNKVYDLEADQTFCALMNNSHTFNADDDGWASVSANELGSGSGYTTNGDEITGTVTVDDTDDEGVFDATDAQWTSATFTAYHAVVWDTTPTSPADPLICSIDFGGAQTVTAGTFTIQWDAEGIVNIG